MNRTLACTRNAAFHNALFAHLYRTAPLVVRPNQLTAQSRPICQNLPRQPVPDLAKTIDKYIASLRPLLTEQQLECSKKVARDFQCSEEAKVLQKMLQDRAKCKENWLSEWWQNTAYLEFREPLPVWSSPGQSFPKMTFCTEEARLEHVAKIVLAMLEYKCLIDANKIPIDKMGKDNLDMNQYKRVFGTNRKPHIPRDRMEYNIVSKHIVVAYNNNYFQVNVIGDDGSIPNVEQLVCQLNDVIGKGCKRGPAVGILTASHRDHWSRAYDCLLQDKTNAVTLCTIQKALFVVCLDNDLKKGSCDDFTRTAEQLLHGGGSKENSANRWFDKTAQFVMSADGIAGIIYEHSPAEGVPIAVMTDFIANYLECDRAKDACGTKCLLEPKMLCFSLNSAVKKAIADAECLHSKLVADLDINCFKFKCYGKEFIKCLKLSPDSFIQMAIQLTFYRLHQKPGAQYETAGTRKFLHGRTETIRSCSHESILFACTMLDDCKSDDEKACALQAAIAAHKKYANDAVNGFGVDRHLLGLRLASVQCKMSLPAIFKDPGFCISSHMRISTSQIATNWDTFNCYGPLVPDGYGCCYNPRKDDINFAITSLKSNSETSSDKFRKALEESLSDMQQLLVKTRKSKM